MHNYMMHNYTNPNHIVSTQLINITQYLNL